jgi:hypothetical protein
MVVGVLERIPCVHQTSWKTAVVIILIVICGGGWILRAA